MKNRSISSTSGHVHQPTRLRGLFAHLFKRSSAADATSMRTVKVWDAQRDSYRNVRLSDRNDPLWPTARELYLISKTRTSRTAA